MSDLAVLDPRAAFVDVGSEQMHVSIAGGHGTGVEQQDLEARSERRHQAPAGIGACGGSDGARLRGAEGEGAIGECLPQPGWSVATRLAGTVSGCIGS